MYRVAVLMSTYNGQKYLKEQIESILAQKGVDITIFIRDDGSSDGTVEIIKNYVKTHDNVRLLIGDNIGVGNSFMEVLYSAEKDNDYYAFADQDDVWLPEKMEEAIDMIKDSTKPALYCSNQILVDKKLNKIGMRFSNDPDVSYKQIMCQNKLSGCTMVWNKKLQDLLSERDRRPSDTLLIRRIHDVWVAMVAAVVGKIIYDSHSYILYRQHESNVVGVKKSNIINQWIQKLKDPTQRNGRSFICREVYLKYGDLIAKELKSSLNVYGNYREELQIKRQLLRDKSILAFTGESKLGFSIKVLTNLF